MQAWWVVCARVCVLGVFVHACVHVLCCVALWVDGCAHAMCDVCAAGGMAGGTGAALLRECPLLVSATTLCVHRNQVHRINHKKTVP